MYLTSNSYLLNEIVKIFNFKIGAELGVKEGWLTCGLLERNLDLILLNIDTWGDDITITDKFDHPTNFSNYCNNILPFVNRIIIYKMITTVACNYVQDNSLDFIYIDANHTYKSLIEDLKAWFPKVKETGLICGHDYNPIYDKGGLKIAIDEYINIEKTSGQIIHPLNCAGLPANDINIGDPKFIIDCLKNNINVADYVNGNWYAWKRNIQYKGIND